MVCGCGIYRLAGGYNDSVDIEKTAPFVFGYGGRYTGLMVVVSFVGLFRFYIFVLPRHVVARYFVDFAPAVVSASISFVFVCAGILKISPSMIKKSVAGICSTTLVFWFGGEIIVAFRPQSQRPVIFPKAQTESEFSNAVNSSDNPYVIPNSYIFEG